MKMAQKVNIKDIIGLLCQILTEHGVHRVSPEIFRQAKFNLPDATKSFWLLLFDILQLIDHAGPQCSKDCLTDVADYVKYSLKELGYFSNVFYDWSCSTEQGSWNLLVAFGWLLAEYRITDLLLDEIETPLFELMIRPETVKRATKSKFAGNKDTLDFVLYMYNKNRNEQKSIRQLFKLVTKHIEHFHSNLHLVSTEQFYKDATPLELFASQCPKKKFDLITKELENEKSLIEAHIGWIENEEIFWKWMASVIEGKGNITTNDKKQESRLDVGKVRDDLGKTSLSAVNKPSSRSNNIGIFDDNVSKLLQILSTKKFTPCSKEQRQRHLLLRPQKYASEINAIGTAIQIIEDATTKTKEALDQLEERTRKLFILDSEDILNDVIHLPMPRR